MAAARSAAARDLQVVAADWRTRLRRAEADLIRTARQVAAGVSAEIPAAPGSEV